MRRIGDKIKPYGFILLFGLLYLPPFRHAFGEATNWFVDAANAPINGSFYGYELFQFWKGSSS